MDVTLELERLRQSLVEERQRRKEAEEREKEEKRQRREAEEREKEEKRQRREAERQTTLPEYLKACHDYLFQSSTIQPDKSLTSKGSMTNPEAKRCPTRLVAWSGFLEQQKTIFGRLYSTFPDDAQVFENVIFLQGLGRRVSNRKVSNEKDLEYTQHLILEEPVSAIVEQLRIQDTDNEFNLEDGIVFENHPNAISDVAEEPAGRRTPPNLNQLRADQICVYKFTQRGAARRRLAFIVEYKAPHKLTLPHLRLGLRDMDIYNDVVNRPTKPAPDDEAALFQYYADRLTAAAVTQTYHYMIEGGLEYSYLTTGEAIVFLKIDWDDPAVLYYHLAEPLAEVEAHPGNFLYCTAVSQVLAFTLLAMGSQAYGQDERRAAITELRTWATDPETILRAIPLSDRKKSPPVSAFKSKTYSNIDRSPYFLRKKTRATREKCRPGDGSRGRSPAPGGSGDESADQLPDTPMPLRLRNRRKIPQPQGEGRRGSADQTRNCGYCTQKCLLGLLNGGLLDRGCPNVSFHGAIGDGRHHPVDHATWLRLLREQLARTLDDGIVPLGEQGARGVLFQVTLMGYGYAFVSKGTVPEFVTDLRHEAAVYRQLRPLQGVSVPVFLGAADLEWPYYYDHRVRIVHLMFLSWAGSPLGRGCGRSLEPRLARELDRSVRCLHRMGVTHNDVREENALWCGETRRVMVIDFERADIVAARRRPIDAIIPNKRAPGDMSPARPLKKIFWRQKRSSTRHCCKAAQSRKGKRRSEGTPALQSLPQICQSNSICVSGR